MKNRKAKSIGVMAVLLAMGLFVSSAGAISKSDVSTTIKQPDNNSTVSAGGFLGGDIHYQVEFTNNGPNKTKVNSTLQFVPKSTGNMYTHHISNFNLSSGETKTKDVYWTPSGYTLPSNKSAVAIRANTVYTDLNTGAKTGEQPSVMFYVKKSTLFSDMVMWALVVGVIGVFTTEL